MIDSLSDLEVLTLTIHGEARGEPIEGQIAVACVIRNRVNKLNTFKGICLAPKQFSCWNQNDPNRPILEEIAQKMVAGQPTGLDQELWVARGIINDSIRDNTNNAKDYLTKKLFDSASVSWAKHPKNPIIIGNQVFFNV